MLASLGELRRYLEEGSAPNDLFRPDWRPLVEEFPGRHRLADHTARRDGVRARYDVVFSQTTKMSSGQSLTCGPSSGG
jgi:hypothetical protein